MTSLDIQATIIRTERGLTIAGTRITLYDVMDYVKAGWPVKLICDRLDLTGKQIVAVMDYLDAHRAEAEAEYQTVLVTAQEIRQYWEERNRERMLQIAQMPPKPGTEALIEKLQAWKANIQVQR